MLTGSAEHQARRMHAALSVTPSYYTGWYRNYGIAYGDGLCVQNNLDDRQIAHLICVHLKHLLYDFLGCVLGLLLVVKKGTKHPLKRHLANV